MATIKKACKGALYPKSSSVSSRLGSYGKKMKSGGSLGMKSVKAGFDKNPGVTRADIIVAGKGEAKKGMKVKKAQAGKTVKQSNADMMKEIAAREKRIAARDSANQRKSYTNERANKVIGKNKMGGKTKKCAYGCK